MWVQVAVQLACEESMGHDKLLAALLNACLVEKFKSMYAHTNRDNTNEHTRARAHTHAPSVGE